MPCVKHFETMEREIARQGCHDFAANLPRKVPIPSKLRLLSRGLSALNQASLWGDELGAA